MTLILVSIAALREIAGGDLRHLAALEAAVFGGVLRVRARLHS